MQPARQRLEHISLSVTPMAVTLFMALVSAVPLRVPGLSAVLPQFVFISIYYWGIFRPTTMPFLFLFALGMVQDTLSGFPLGVSSFVNMGLGFLLMVERPLFGKMLFASVWIGFIILTALAYIAQWSILSLYSATLLPMFLTVLQWSATCLAYPLMHVLFTKFFHTGGNA